MEKWKTSLWNAGFLLVHFSLDSLINYLEEALRATTLSPSDIIFGRCLAHIAAKLEDQDMSVNESLTCISPSELKWLLTKLARIAQLPNRPSIHLTLNISAQLQSGSSFFGTSVCFAIHENWKNLLDVVCSNGKIQMSRNFHIPEFNPEWQWTLERAQDAIVKALSQVTLTSKALQFNQIFFKICQR